MKIRLQRISECDVCNPTARRSGGIFLGGYRPRLAANGAPPASTPALLPVLHGGFAPQPAAEPPLLVGVHFLLRVEPSNTVFQIFAPAEGRRCLQ